MAGEIVYSKAWYRSRGVWGSLLAAAGTGYGFWALALPCGFWESFHGYASSALALLGSLLSFIGRTSASQPIHFFWRYKVERE